MFSETVPAGLRLQADAALKCFEAQEGAAFQVTGVANVQAALDDRKAPAQVLELVLCGQGRCELRRFELRGGPKEFDVTILESEDHKTEGVVPAELDPPPGARASWLDDKLAAHTFVVLVFYRGLW